MASPVNVMAMRSVWLTGSSSSFANVPSSVWCVFWNVMKHDELVTSKAWHSIEIMLEIEYHRIIIWDSPQILPGVFLCFFFFKMTPRSESLWHTIGDPHGDPVPNLAESRWSFQGLYLACQGCLVECLPWACLACLACPAYQRFRACHLCPP